MSSTTSPILSARGQVASLTAKCKPGDPKLIEARQKLTTLVLRQYVEKTLASAPPLTEAQRESIIALLRNGGGVTA